MFILICRDNCVSGLVGPFSTRYYVSAHKGYSFGSFPKLEVRLNTIVTKNCSRKRIIPPPSNTFINTYISLITTRYIIAIFKNFINGQWSGCATQSTVGQLFDNLECMSTFIHEKIIYVQFIRTRLIFMSINIKIIIQVSYKHTSL